MMDGGKEWRQDWREETTYTEFTFKNMTTPIKIRDEKHLSGEVIRSLRFFSSQIKKGWNPISVLSQIENSYGKRVHYFVLLSLKT